MNMSEEKILKEVEIYKKANSIHIEFEGDIEFIMKGNNLYNLLKKYFNG
jgi:hypothetical protein